ncbi:hypothetical protein LVD15_12075 [Fulvivirga maritima]|uniref:hypothetical protein n=1 Tax=Fulvivirga maritima TaxID=2904247 RepID=UPI001F2E7489|nr:hypothetical protein [Fulvivirga maritima]UII29132.1 hypothetical protein LVD15_12075 [Fulvivirga maritima]
MGSFIVMDRLALPLWLGLVFHFSLIAIIILHNYKHYYNLPQIGSIKITDDNIVLSADEEIITILGNEIKVINVYPHLNLGSPTLHWDGFKLVEVVIKLHSGHHFTKIVYNTKNGFEYKPNDPSKLWETLDRFGGLHNFRVNLLLRKKKVSR